MKKRNVLNPSNILSLLRILLTPIIVWQLFAERQNFFVCLYFFAAISDFFDGLLARKHNWVTEVGIALDAVADKILSISILIAFVVHGDIKFVWMLAMSSRDVAVVLEGIVFFSQISTKKALTAIPASKLSKITTLVLFVSIGAIALGLLKDFFVILSSILSVATAMQYIILGMKFFQKQKTARKNIL